MSKQLSEYGLDYMTAKMNNIIKTWNGIYSSFEDIRDNNHLNKDKSDIEESIKELEKKLIEQNNKMRFLNKFSQK